MWGKLKDGWKKGINIVGDILDKVSSGEKELVIKETPTERIYSYNGITYSEDKRTGATVVANTGNLGGANSPQTGYPATSEASLLEGNNILIVLGIGLLIWVSLRK